MPQTQRTYSQGAEVTLWIDLRVGPPAWSRWTAYRSGDYVRDAGRIFQASQNTPTGRPGSSGAVGWTESSGRYTPDTIRLLITDAAGATTTWLVSDPSSRLLEDDVGVYRAKIPTDADGPALGTGEAFWKVYARVESSHSLYGDGVAEWVGHVTPAAVVEP